MLAEEAAKLLYRVGVDAVGGYFHAGAGRYLLGDGVAFAFRARREHDFSKDVGMLGAFVNDYRSNAAGAYDQYFSHLYIVFVSD